MPEFKTREEYEAWKAQKLQAKSSQQKTSEWAPFSPGQIDLRNKLERQQLSGSGKSENKPINPALAGTLILLLIFLGIVSIYAHFHKSKEEYKEELDKRNIGFTVENFMILSVKGDVETIRLFLNAGMNINEKYQERSALYYAAIGGKVDAVELLINNGASVNTDSPSILSDIQMLVNVIDNGLQSQDVNIRNKWLAEDARIGASYRKIINALKAAGAN